MALYNDLQREPAFREGLLNSKIIQTRSMKHSSLLLNMHVMIVLQATPFAERERVWSRCNHRVVATTETCQDQSDPRSSWIACIVMEYNYVTTCFSQIMSASYYLTAMVDNCVPRRQLGSCSVTRPFLSLRRVWLVRLHVMIDLYRLLSGHSVPCIILEVKGHISNYVRSSVKNINNLSIPLSVWLFQKLLYSMSTDLYS